MDLDIYLRFALALVFVLALIGLIGWVARRYGPTGRTIGGGRQRRLGIVEATPLDAKRRLVLVRRDGMEHLLLLGPGRDIVVESGIGSAPVAATAPAPGPAFSELVSAEARSS